MATKKTKSTKKPTEKRKTKKPSFKLDRLKMGVCDSTDRRR